MNALSYPSNFLDQGLGHLQWLEKTAVKASTMDLIRRQTTKTWPYAPASTGRYRGNLLRKYSCWEANGPAREIFTSEIAEKIKLCLENCLPEANTFIAFSLFMVGKVPQKTKPTIMVVSDDKRRRKAAFETIKSSSILAEYPGFEIGQCSLAAEFEDLQQLGEHNSNSKLTMDMSELTAYTSQSDGGLLAPMQVHFHTSDGDVASSATVGGFLFHRGKFYCLTAAHAILRDLCRHHNSEESSPNIDSASDSDDCEITGVEDWDTDDDEELDESTEIFSLQANASSNNTSESSEDEDDPITKEDVQNQRATNGDEVKDPGFPSGSNLESPSEFTAPAVHKDCTPIGKVIHLQRDLDIALIPVVAGQPWRQINWDQFIYLPAVGHDVSGIIEDPLEDCKVIVRTMHHPEIEGRMSATPFYAQQPASDKFQLLHAIQFAAPLRPGDCGAWVCRRESGRLVGFVVGGSPKTGLCLIIPAAKVLEHLLSLRDEDWTGALEDNRVKHRPSGSRRAVTFVDAPRRRESVSPKPHFDFQPGTQNYHCDHNLTGYPTPPDSIFSCSEGSSSYTSSEDRGLWRRSGVYINGEKILDTNRKSSRHERRKSDRIVMLDSPFSPSSSPRFDIPPAVPSLRPSYDVYESRTRQYHTRPEVRIEANDHHRAPRSPRRYPITAKDQSHGRKYDEEYESKTLPEEIRGQNIQVEIDRQNEAIASPPAVPAVPAVPRVTRSRRPSVSARQPVDELADAIRYLRVNQREMEAAEAAEAAERRRARRLQEQREEEAQRRRLTARMMPDRKNTLEQGDHYDYDEELYQVQ